MDTILYNPVFHALDTGDASLSAGTDIVKYFHQTVSPFVGIKDHDAEGFNDLHAMLPVGRRILYAIPEHIVTPRGWELMHKIEGVQMVFNEKECTGDSDLIPVALSDDHIPQMVELATLTKPGPFDTGTKRFGNYHGFFSGERLIAMTGQRLHPTPYTEVSAVCTHPDHLGKGYAYALVLQQTKHILTEQRIPFLHVRADNARAIALYERIGYRIERPMIFYFMRSI